jgi:hypothetical protein
MKDIYAGNYKPLSKEIKGGLIKWKYVSCP